MREQIKCGGGQQALLLSQVYQGGQGPPLLQSLVCRGQRYVGQY